MPYLCYVHRRTGAAPYFEVLPEMSQEQALRRAGALLAERPDGECAELWQDDLLLVTLHGAEADS